MNEDQAKGKAKQTEGQAQEAWGDVKEKADDAWDEAKDKLDDLGDKFDDMKDELDQDDEDDSREGEAAVRSTGVASVSRAVGDGASEWRPVSVGAESARTPRRSPDAGRVADVRPAEEPTVADRGYGNA